MSTKIASSQLPVLIIGAGISGLTLGQGLLKASIPFRIFERDPSINQRTQGYRVRINSVGIDALSSTLSPSLLDRLKESCAINLGGCIWMH
jgi:protoporphyrinogen oxidase